MSKRIIISGGGTGGHIFPAISIANALKDKMPDAEILFVGAEGKMEMEKVPAAGYKIIGLPVAGFQRRLTLQNFSFFFKLFASLQKAKSVVAEFKPDIAIGVGGYASGPTLKVAANKGIPTLLQEQNSYAGVTNKLLAKKAKKICVAYEKMERFFPAEKILLTGNPVRKDLLKLMVREDANKELGLQNEKRTLLVVGGSLGARSINNAIAANLEKLASDTNVQLLWQTGKLYYDEMKAKADAVNASNIHVVPFISRMDYAYRAAHLVISRAGAGTISELCLVGKASILVPSPNVSEDHQTKNAMALVDKGAAVLVQDKNANEQLINKALELLKDRDRSNLLSDKIKKMAQHDSAERIAEEAIQLMQ